MRSAVVKDFTHRIESQPFDSLLKFLSVELQQDSVAKSEIQLATGVLSKLTCECRWLNIRTNENGYECRYTNMDKTYILISLTFGTGEDYKIITKIKIWDENRMKKDGIDSSPFPPPPPPPPPPPTPKHR